MTGGKFIRSFARCSAAARTACTSPEGMTKPPYFCIYGHGFITKRTLKGEEV